MSYASIEELNQALADRREGRVLVLPATEIITLVGYFDGTKLMDSVVVMKNNDEWEIIEGAKAQKVAQLYIAYFGELIDLISTKIESDLMFNEGLID